MVVTTSGQHQSCSVLQPVAGRVAPCAQGQAGRLDFEAGRSPTAALWRRRSKPPFRLKCRRVSAPSAIVAATDYHKAAGYAGATTLVGISFDVVMDGLRGFGRYSEAALLILVSLASGAKHGYAIMEDVKQLARLQLGPGTLYGALSRLERLGLIGPLPMEDRRRPYRLTATGAGVLKTELTTLRSIVDRGLAGLAPA
jgi:DNA-binding PadR family transcriptional regulator